MKYVKKRRAAPSIESSSMADMAFLLLVFFLVSTTIKEDAGILVRLPPPTLDNTTTEIVQRNLCQIHINASDELRVRKVEMEVGELKEFLMEFIMNPERKEDLARSPNKAVISLMNHKSTSYTRYIDVYNEIKAAYNSLRNQRCKEQYGISYEFASLKQRRSIADQIPQIISEADPFGS